MMISCFQEADLTKPVQEELYDFKNKWPVLWTYSIFFPVTDKLTFLKVQDFHLRAVMWMFSDR